MIVLYVLVLYGGHLDGCDRRFNTLVAVPAARAVYRLLHGIVSQHAKDNWRVITAVQFGNAVRGTLAYKIKVACFTLDD